MEHTFILPVINSQVFWLGFILAFVASISRGTIAGSDANVKKWIGIAAAVAVAVVLLYNYNGNTLEPLLFGVVAGLIVDAVRRRAGRIAIAIVAILVLYFSIGPNLNEFRTVRGTHAQGIHNDSLSLVDAMMETLSGQNKPTIDAAKRGEMNLAEQAAMLSNRGRIGFQQITNEKRAMLELDGIVFGDFGVPAAIIVKPKSGTGELDMATLYRTPKQVCDSATVTARGLVNSDARERTLNREVDGRGWVDGDGSPLPDPSRWEGYHKVYEDAPYMASLVFVGNNPTPFYDWQPIEKDENGKVIAVSQTIVASGCQAVKWAFNDYMADNSGRPNHRPDFMANNYGTYPLNPKSNWERDTKRGGGIQVEIE